MLKTDYKNDQFEGNRKYEITDNSDGTYSFEDVTEYEESGDTFGADDINDTNTAVNRLNHITSVILSSSGWSGSSAPYSQTVSVSDVTAEDNPLLVSMLADGADESTQKAYSKAFGIVASGTATTADGSVTFKVYKKPSTSITVGLKGV